MPFGGPSAPTVMPSADPPTPKPTPVVIDPQGLQKWMGAGMGSDTQHNKMAAGGFQLGQQVALGTGRTGQRSLFGPKTGQVV